jgi:hypothetical protein
MREVACESLFSQPFLRPITGLIAGAREPTLNKKKIEAGRIIKISSGWPSVKKQDTEYTLTPTHPSSLKSTLSRRQELGSLPESTDKMAASGIDAVKSQKT